MTILQIAHITETPGPVQALARYFHKKNAKLFRIYHPLEGASIDHSDLFDGEISLAQKKRAKAGWAGYFFDFFLTLGWISKIKGPIDKAIGMNCFDTFPLIVYRYFRKEKIKRIIFFNTDFSRRRFSNNFLNSIYVFLDKFCAGYADVICCNSQRTIGQRIKEGVDSKKILYIPNGVFMDETGEIKYAEKKYQKKLLYIGRISEEHGLGDIIGALADFDLTIDIFGSGGYEKTLQKIVKEKDLSSKVNFMGARPHEEVMTSLKNFSGFGIAPYSDISDWTYYCDPVKVKEYLAYSVPVIISDIPEIAEKINYEKAGFVYQDRSALVGILKGLDSLSDNDYREMSKSARRLGENSDLGKIYEKI